MAVGIIFITMVIDHVGLVYFPDLWQLRVIGRVCFPLVLVNYLRGLVMTSNLQRYMMRLALWGIVACPFYWFVVGWRCNILVVLSAGVLVVILMRGRWYILACLVGVLMLGPGIGYGLPVLGVSVGVGCGLIRSLTWWSACVMAAALWFYAWGYGGVIQFFSVPVPLVALCLERWAVWRYRWGGRWFYRLYALQWVPLSWGVL